MLDLSLLAPEGTTSSAIVTSSLYGNSSASVLARSRRPAILTYASPIVDTANTLSGLPWHVLGWKKESELLEVDMMEGVEFAKGWMNVPQNVKVVVEADEKMQFYEVGIRIIAKLGGLRWILYHHRVLSFLFFTTTFWSSSMLSMLCAWFILSSYIGPSPAATKAEPDANGSYIKRERSDSDTMDPTSIEDLSDTSRTFPTFGRQKPLHFSSRGLGKKEEDEEAKWDKDEVMRSTDIQPLTAEADDEADEMTEEMSGWRDSGIGTGLDEERLASVQRRRKAMMGSGASGRG
jgi:seipin